MVHHKIKKPLQALSELFASVISQVSFESKIIAELKELLQIAELDFSLFF
jgi:hypothetical protein